MRLLALLSGGKDSLHAAVYAQYVLGHEIVACANLYPVDEDDGVVAASYSPDAPERVAECDSYMYQTAGAHVVGAAFPACLPPPVRLYRWPTRCQRGVHDRVAYRASAPEEEVEALLALVQHVQHSMRAAGEPPLGGLVSGAILSDYQRCRMESVANRCGLVSLAPLWHRRQSALLDEMLALGIQAIMVKVAAAGLDAHHLGQPLAEMLDRLRQLEQRYGVHVCGEGGEYETLVLDCAWFHSRIVVEAAETVDGGSGSAWLRIQRWRVEPKSPERLADDAALLQRWVAQVEPLWPMLKRWPRMRNVVAASKLSDASDVGLTPSTAPLRVHFRCGTVRPNSGTGTDVWHALLWASVVETPTSSATAHSPTVAHQLQAILEQLAALLRQTGCAPYMCLLYLDDLREFAAANRVYGAFFAADEYPPTRCCIQVARLRHPTGRVMLEVYAEPAGGTRHALHVQCLSLWAPACIGPYCQARLQHDGRVLYLSGIIALYPPTGDIPAELHVGEQMRACLWNADRIVKVYEERSGGGIEAPAFRCAAAVVYVQAADRVACEHHAADVQPLLPLPQDSPHQVVIGVPALPRDALVELQLIYEVGAAATTSLAVRGVFVDWERACATDIRGWEAREAHTTAFVLPCLLPETLYGHQVVRCWGGHGEDAGASSPASRRPDDASLKRSGRYTQRM
eukprot:ctg_281.g171